MLESPSGTIETGIAADHIDWSRPIFAHAVRGNSQPFAVTIDPRYHAEPGRTPVRFSTNLWVDHPTPGTWYFDDLGRSIGGTNADGVNDARFVIRSSK
jgi:hypothetical protein